MHFRHLQSYRKIVAKKLLKTKHMKTYMTVLISSLRRKVNPELKNKKLKLRSSSKLVRMSSRRERKVHLLRNAMWAGSRQFKTEWKRNKMLLARRRDTIRGWEAIRLKLTRPFQSIRQLPHLPPSSAPTIWSRRIKPSRWSRRVLLSNSPPSYVNILARSRTKRKRSVIHSNAVSDTRIVQGNTSF